MKRGVLQAQCEEGGASGPIWRGGCFRPNMERGVLQAQYEEEGASGPI